jgi:hypothetical protein
VKFSLPSEYKDYGDIFSPAEYIEIAENPQIAYTINLKEDITAFYRLIYYFSERNCVYYANILKKISKKISKKIKFGIQNY